MGRNILSSCTQIYFKIGEIYPTNGRNIFWAGIYIILLHSDGEIYFYIGEIYSRNEKNIFLVGRNILSSCTQMGIRRPDGVMLSYAALLIQCVKSSSSSLS